METLQSFNRRDLSLHDNLVKEVLPEYFQRDYPNLIAFLEGYYEFTDGTESVDIIKDLYSIRDIEAATASQLDQIFKEIAGGASKDYFLNPREALRMFANFYRVKGSRYSAEGFFRAFFNETVQIDFPKVNMFILNQAESKIGAESLHFLQNAQLYQIFSILIRSSIPIVRWKELYRQFVHPAGFFIGGEVVLELTPSENLFGIGTMPNVVLLDSSEVSKVTVENSATYIFGTASHEITGRVADGIDSDNFQSHTRLVNISKYATMPIAELIASYGTIAPGADGVLDVNSPTFDEDSGRVPGVIRLSNAVETMDFERFEDYNDSIN
jgi:hypothetical protein|tara:strand:- start:2005 stop:2982 length:978 start_codon:yes stop_codon:yes gene_type:complete